MAKIRRCVGRKRRRNMPVESEVGSCAGGNSNSDNDDDYCTRKLKEIEESYTDAEPVIRCAWMGDFDLRYDESIYHRRIYSFSAFVSSKACRKVHDTCAAFGEVINLEMVPKSSIWPKSFEALGGPSDQDIGIYLFPPLPLHQPLYDALVNEMIHDDLAMKATVPNGELLVFASTELPLSCVRFQDDFYLRGVFRNPPTPTSHDL